MKTVKLLIVLIGLTFMSTGCRHDHHDHEEKSSKIEQSNHTHKTEKEDEKHRH
ncbi:hypothetical protein [Pedobacter ureilyticus]|uniref:hypothetical protein n=1 Tax=Pedobacter ureilyticus TaxID=1393051 RepID=UPI001B8AD2CD|nr:hypothetical protein [Pedobacter helvus]